MAVINTSSLHLKYVENHIFVCGRPPYCSSIIKVTLPFTKGGISVGHCLSNMVISDHYHILASIATALLGTTPAKALCFADAPKACHR